MTTRCSFYADRHIDRITFVGCQVHNQLPEDCARHWQEKYLALLDAYNELLTDIEMQADGAEPDDSPDVPYDPPDGVHCPGGDA